MAESTESPPAKRLRMTNEPEQVPRDVAKPGNPPLDPISDDGPLPAFSLDRVDTKFFLLHLVQTDAGIDDLANALKDRHIRDALEERGLKVNAADGVGYKSLPLELRDHIRGYVIADLEQGQRAEHKCKRCPRLSTYACIDAEWQATVESTTFKNIRMKDIPDELVQDLDLFAQYVVGNRRHYLQHVHLRCTGKAQTSAKMIHRLFSCMQRWQEVVTQDRILRIDLSYSNVWSSYSVPLQIELSKLPNTSQFTGLFFSASGIVHAEAFRAVLVCLPQLKNMTICDNHSDLDFWSSEITEGRKRDYPGAQLFFNRLSQNVPNLESLDISAGLGHRKYHRIDYRTAIFSYSQKLSELKLRDVDREATLDWFSPFRTENIVSSGAAPPSWPNLTRFNIGAVYDAHYEGDAVEIMSDLMLPIARAVRYMPLIQSLTFDLWYNHPRSKSGYGEDDANAICFELKVLRDDALNGLRAVLSLTHSWFDPGWNVAEALASETAKELWRESLLNGANAVLEFEVECEGDADDDA